MVGVKLWVARRCHERETRPDHRPRHRTEGPDPPAHLVQGDRQPGRRVAPAPTSSSWRSGTRRRRSSAGTRAATGNSASGRSATARTCCRRDRAARDPTTGFVEMAVRELGAERVVYGSDAGGRSLRLADRQGRRAPTCPTTAKRLILEREPETAAHPDPHGQGDEAVTDRHERPPGPLAVPPARVRGPDPLRREAAGGEDRRGLGGELRGRCCTRTWPGSTPGWPTSARGTTCWSRSGR